MQASWKLVVKQSDHIDPYCTSACIQNLHFAQVQFGSARVRPFIQKINKKKGRTAVQLSSIKSELLTDQSRPGHERSQMLPAAHVSRETRQDEGIELETL
jgi:hypothetical protein